MDRRTIWIGFDPREAGAFVVARNSLKRHMAVPIAISGVVLSDLRQDGLYRRPTERRDNRLWDTISGAPMSTEFAVSRFLVPHLARSGWALFMDCDVLIRGDVTTLFEKADPKKAVMVVQHDYQPPEGTKMDGQAQLQYARKNWSSVMLINCDHPANKKLTVDLVNTVPGRDLHRFSWLKDSEIGELAPRWNYLVGHTVGLQDPQIVHFTAGIPAMPGYEECEYSSEWWAELNAWAR